LIHNFCFTSKAKKEEPFKIIQMKKTIITLAIAFLTVNATAQDVQTATKEKAKKESCCAKKDSKSKAMSADEIEKCQVKCKAEGKKCDASMAKASGKKC
jgi:hypothetical protein